MTDSQSDEMTDPNIEKNGYWSGSEVDNLDTTLIHNSSNHINNKNNKNNNNEINNKNNYIKNNITKLNSPWKDEFKKSTSSLSTSSSIKSMIIKMTPRNKFKKRNTANFTTKKNIFDKTNGYYSKKKTPRARWPINNKTKYCWTGRFNNHQKKIYFNNNKSNICSLTRTPSPGDPDEVHFFYGNDNDTMTKVFHLNNHKLNNHDDYEKFKPEKDDLLIDDEQIDENNKFDDNIKEKINENNKNIKWNLHDNIINNTNFFFENNYDEYELYNLTNDKRKQYRDKYKNVEVKKTFYKSIKDYLLTFIVNVAVFSVLPIIYILFFIFIHRNDEEIE